MTPSPGWPCCKGWTISWRRSRITISATVLLRTVSVHLGHSCHSATASTVSIASVGVTGRRTHVAEPELWTHAKIRIHAGKTHQQVQLHAGGVRCSGESCCRIRQHTTAQVWRGSALPTREQGIKVLGCLGSCGVRDDAIGSHCQETPSVVAGYCQRQGCAVGVVAVASLRRSSSQLPLARHQATFGGPGRTSGIPVTLCDEMAKATATPLALGGMGLRSAGRELQHTGRVERTTLPMIQERHTAVHSAAWEWTALTAFSCQSGRLWRVGCALSRGNQNITSWVPRGQDGNTKLPVVSNAPLQRHVHPASPQPNAMDHVEIGPVAGFPFSTTPSSFLTPLEPALFWVLLQRRLSLLLCRVAVCSTHLATTVQLAHGQEGWGEEVAILAQVSAFVQVFVCLCTDAESPVHVPSIAHGSPLGPATWWPHPARKRPLSGTELDGVGGTPTAGSSFLAAPVSPAMCLGRAHHPLEGDLQGGTVGVQARISHLGRKLSRMFFPIRRPMACLGHLARGSPVVIWGHQQLRTTHWSVTLAPGQCACVRSECSARR